jgi:zinc/manganese transport system ATP-binding protein
VTAITCDRVSIALSGKTILSDISLAIDQGEFIGVLGPNGAGKTTLMRALLGVIRLRAGRLLVLDEPVRRGNKAVGYAPQLRSSLAPHLRISGWEFVACVAEGHRWGLPFRSAAERHSIDRAIDLVEAGDLARRPLADLSGGERQRLLIAQALIGAPKILLLDEPLISLDLHHQQSIITTVRRIQRDEGMTVLLCAHEINPLLSALDRVLYLGNGHAALGAVDDVITGPVLSKLFGSEIDVIRLGGRIFVMSGSHSLEQHAHEHDA